MGAKSECKSTERVPCTVTDGKEFSGQYKTCEKKNSTGHETQVAMILITK